MTRLWIPGRPVPAARPRVAAGHAYTPAGYREWLEAAAWEVKAAGIDRRTGPVTVNLVIHPTGIGIGLSEPPPPVGRGGLRGDLDNYIKAALDALTGGGAWEDDRQVSHLTARFSPHPLRRRSLR